MKKKKTKGKWTLQLRKAALKVAKLGVRAAGYSRDEAGFRASGLVHDVLRPFKSKRDVKLDLCLVVPDKSRGWILEAACLEIAKHFDGNWKLWGNLEKLPRAKSYFFSHYHFYLSALKQNPNLWSSRSVVWITHPKELNFGGPSTIYALKNARIVTMCSMWRDLLIDLGLPASQVKTIVGAADPGFFRTHQRGSGKVGLCTAYYDRKSPNRIIDLIRSLPNTPFVLMGRNWRQYDQFENLLKLPNFEYRECSYQDYPSFYDELDVFVSLSELEGGPIPLIESMMSNVVPVATRTGFAPDLIRHGDNGYLCNVDAPISEVSALVEKALINRNAIRPSVEHLSWKNFSLAMQAELGLLSTSGTPAENVSLDARPEVCAA